MSAPSTAAATRAPLRSWLPAVVAIGVLVLLIVGVGLTASRQPAAVASAADYLAPGTTYQRIETDTGTQVWESSVLSGIELVTSGPWWLGLSLEDFNEVVAGRWLRVAITGEGAEGVQRQLILYQLADDGLRLTTLWDGADVTFFKPGVPVLPADRRSSWSEDGVVEVFGDDGAKAPYTANSSLTTVSVDGRDGDCLQVETTIDVTFAPALDATWCPGAGLILPGSSAAPDPVGADAVADSTESQDPASWQVEEVATQLEPPMVWATSLPPVATDDLLVVAQTPGNDLVFIPGEDPEAAWRAHPGGAITALERHGDLIVAATSQADLVGYDTTGTWRWTLALPDIVTAPGAQAGSSLRLVDAAAGVASVDLSTGQLQWRTALDDPVISAPAACEEMTYVGTTAGEVVAIDADGEIAWRVTLADRPGLVACVPGGVVAISPGTIDRISADGNWQASVASRDGAIASVRMVGDVLVTASGRLLTGYRPGTLSVAWRQERQCPQTFSVADTLVCAGSSEVTVLDVGGTVLNSQDVSPTVELIDTWALTESGLLRYGQPFTVVRVR